MKQFCTTIDTKYYIGNADDLLTLVQGKHNVVTGHLQEALNLIISWTKEKRLNTSSSKLTVEAFAKRTKLGD